MLKYQFCDKRKWFKNWEIESLNYNNYRIKVISIEWKESW